MGQHIKVLPVMTLYDMIWFNGSVASDAIRPPFTTGYGPGWVVILLSDSNLDVLCTPCGDETLRHIQGLVLLMNQVWNLLFINFLRCTTIDVRTLP